MSFYEQFTAYVTTMLQTHTSEALDYLSVNSRHDGTYSFKLYEKDSLDGKAMDNCSQSIFDSGLVASSLYVSSGLTGIDRYDFHISNQCNTDERMIGLLNVLQNEFDIAPDAMQEITILSQIPVFPENSGFRALYCVGVERKEGQPHICKLHFRTRMSIRYQDHFMDEYYLDYLEQRLPLVYGIPCTAARQAVQTGHLLLAGVDCQRGNIVKRKLYIKITNTDGSYDAICGISNLPHTYKAFFAELTDAVSRDDRMFIDGFALCFSHGSLSSINYYLALRRNR